MGQKKKKSVEVVRAVMEANTGTTKEVQGRAVHGGKDGKCGRIPGEDVLEGSFQGERERFEPPRKRNHMSKSKHDN